MSAPVPSVVVLKTVSNPWHTGAVAVARSLGRLGVAGYLLGESPTAPAARSRYVAWAGPLPDASAGEILERLQTLNAPRPALLVPVDDPGALFVAEHAEALRGRFVLPDVAADTVRTMLDKQLLSEAAAAAGVPVASGRRVRTLDELERYLASAAFPLVVKTLSQVVLHERGAPSVTVAADVAAARAAWQEQTSNGEFACLVQEYLPGGPQAVQMATGYADERSVLRFAASGRKLRQYPVGSGFATLARSERNDMVLDHLARLVSALGYRGPVDADFHLDPRDGRCRVLDLNPRVGAAFALWQADDGNDLVRTMYDHLSGGRTGASGVPDGRLWRSEVHDLLARSKGRSAVAERPRRPVSRHAGGVERAWFQREDPAPALALWASAGQRSLDRVASRARRRRR